LILDAVVCLCYAQNMATDFEFKLKAKNWTPPSSTAQASLRILKTKHGNQFIGKYSNSKAKQIQRTLALMLADHIPDQPLTGAISLSIIYRFAYRKTEPKANLLNDWMPHSTRPDADNLCKLLLDTMNGKFWEDDSQRAHLSIYKQRGHDPHIHCIGRQI
jgi:Holliday junction resolvase RusA-like endonuclease